MSTTYLTADEVQSRFGIAVGTLANRRTLGQGPAFVKLPNGRIRYRLADLETWIESGYVGAAA